MAIRKSKINIDTEERSDFDNMMNDIENEVDLTSSLKKYVFYNWLINNILYLCIT